MTSDEINPVHLPARTILPPTTISPEAQLHLSLFAANPRAPWPDPADKEAWRTLVIERDAMFKPMIERLLDGSKTPVKDREFGGVPCYVARPEGWDETRDNVYLFFHGGGFVFGGGELARAQAALNADRLGMLCLSVDYRMPPDHPFPAAIIDGLAVYETLIQGIAPERIVIGGSSAGGNIAAAVTLLIRDRDKPLPAGTVLLTPEVDLTESGDTFRTNALIDVTLKGGLPECNKLYAGDTLLTEPYLSPLFADLSQFPPSFIQAGTRDVFLSNSVMFHRKLRAAGVRADLHVWEGMPHGGFGGLSPEDADLHREVRLFIESVTKG